MKVTKAEIEEILKKNTLSSLDYSKLEAYEPNDDRNRLYSFFTPLWLCEVMFDLAKQHGFKPKTGKVLEPACGTGNFLSVCENQKNVTAFELDRINYNIAKARSPKATIYNNFFETAFLQEPRFRSHLPKGKTTWLDNYPFDLVIGNPPYGKNTNHYSSYFKKLKMPQVELFFMYQSMRLLKPGGLLVFITASGFMRNDKTYSNQKELIGELTDFLDAYRMPKVFKNTDVPTDILIFRRK